MADDETTTTTTEDEPQDPPVDVADEPSAGPTAEALLEQERAQRLRLEGENRALREQVKPVEPVKAPLTLDEIEAAFSNGQLTDAQRIDLRADLRVTQRLQEREAEVAKTRPVALAQERLSGYLGQYPALNDSNSELLGKVTVQLRDLTDLGYDPKDVRTQLMAVERVVGGHRLAGGGGVDGRDFNRRKILTGGTTGPGVGKSDDGGKPDPLKDVPKRQIEYWKRMNYTQKEMEAEAPFAKARPHRQWT